MASILVIEDEPLLARQVSRSLERSGHEVRVAANGLQGIEAAEREAPDLVLLDLRLPDRSGIDVLDAVRAVDPTVAVVIMTAHASVPNAVEAMRRGALDYLAKPLDLDELSLLVQRLITRQRRDRELTYLRRRDRPLPHRVIGEDARLKSVFEHARRIAEANLAPGDRPTILLRGETGTGKGLVARAIHEVLGDGPYVELNCSAVPATLIEAELFGHERGSFTDAKTSRVGLFEAADGGTLFLDEIGDLAPDLQAKFLKVIEEKKIRRIGSLQDREANVHVIAATHRNLEEAVADGSFRADLLHRLCVLAFEIPPLRERPDDLPAIAQHVAAELGKKYRGESSELDASALAALRGYPWPGNVRELRNVLERTILVHPQRVLDAGALAGQIETGRPSDDGMGFRLPVDGVALESVERSLIEQALERTGRNRTQAAALLGLSRDTLRYRLEKWGIE